MKEHRRRAAVALITAIVALGAGAFGLAQQYQTNQQSHISNPSTTQQPSSPAIDSLNKLSIKGRAPKTGYTRAQFSADWQDLGPCDVRNYILARDMTGVQKKSTTDCTVMSGTLNDPYTGKIIQFVRGPDSSKVQIDHVVALSDAWQKGAQQLTSDQRYQLANDPLELLAVDGPANNQKSDGDAATWLPSNKAYRCAYVARQVAVKQKYNLWVTQAEHDAIADVLGTCPGQVLPVVTTN